MPTRISTNPFQEETAAAILTSEQDDVNVPKMGDKPGVLTVNALND